MGNNNVACYRHSGSLPFPCHLQLGRDATINLTTSVFHKWGDGSYADKAEVSYTVQGSTCNLELIGSVDKNGRVYILSLTLHDSIACLEKLWLQVFKSETGFTTLEYKSNCSSIAWTKTKKKVDAWGGVTETKVYLYGTTNRCGLLIWEHKKNDSDEDAKSVTVAHYYVRSSGTVAVNRSCETTDIGFSVVVKIAESDGKFDITVEGPERHPVSALLYMFHEVNRSGIWKPSMCPHCGNVRRNMSSSQSDREESDGRQRNAVRINNGGRFNGHANGSSITCTNFYASYKGKP
ncbi:hypothetical protein ACSQ67_009444 [Phaseolus vulgaris]